MTGQKIIINNKHFNNKIFRVISSREGVPSVIGYENCTLTSFCIERARACIEIRLKALITAKLARRDSSVDESALLELIYSFNEASLLKNTYIDDIRSTRHLFFKEKRIKRYKQLEL